MTKVKDHKIGDENAEKEAGLAAVDAVVKGDSYLATTLGAIVVKSDLHPQWINVSFPDYGTAAGTRLKQIRGAIAELMFGRLWRGGSTFIRIEPSMH